MIFFVLHDKKHFGLNSPIKNPFPNENVLCCEPGALEQIDAGGNEELVIKTFPFVFKRRTQLTSLQKPVTVAVLH